MSAHRGGLLLAGVLDDPGDAAMPAASRERPKGGHAPGHTSLSHPPEVTPVEEICADCRWHTDSLAHHETCRGAAA